MGKVKELRQEEDHIEKISNRVLEKIQEQSQQEILAKDLGETSYQVLERVQSRLHQENVRTLLVRECGELVLCVWG